MSARGRAGGIVKVLLDGEGSFITQGTNVDGGLEPKSFTSKIVSNKGTSEISMVFDGGSVKELAATPLPGSDRVPVTETNRQAVFDPLTAMLFSASVVNEQLSKDACRHTLPIFDGQQRYDLKLAFKRWTRRQLKKDTPARWWCAPSVTNRLPATARRTLLSNTFPKVAKWSWRSHRLPARTG